jgi:YihY family inner membrane protein
MSLVVRVPETSRSGDGELDAGDAGQTLRRVGRRTLLKESFKRFRYGDGFSHARALGLQLSLAVFPLSIALVGLSTVVHADKLREVITRTLLALTPGSSEETIKRVLEQGQQNAGDGGLTALLGGLIAAMVAMTTAVAQVERGANRIYGIERDRPTHRKYARAFVLMLVAGLPALLGFLILVAGGPLGDAATSVYGWGHTTHAAYMIVRWPLGALLCLVAITLLFRYAPRRKQPGRTWLAVGAAAALLMWLALTLVLVLYLRMSGSTGATYGPLTGIIAVLIWANLTSIALLFGIAMGAQLEAARVGITPGAPPDPEPDDC